MQKLHQQHPCKEKARKVSCSKTGQASIVTFSFCLSGNNLVKPCLRCVSVKEGAASSKQEHVDQPRRLQALQTSFEESTQ